MNWFLYNNGLRHERVKKKRGIKCEKFGGFIARHNFEFFYEESDGIFLGTRFMITLAKFTKMFSRVFESWIFDASGLTH